jgi:hypothetical protein
MRSYNLPEELLIKILNYNNDFYKLGIKMDINNYRFIIKNDEYLRKHIYEILFYDDNLDCNCAYNYYNYIQNIINNNKNFDNLFYLKLFINDYNHFFYNL